MTRTEVLSYSFLLCNELTTYKLIGLLAVKTTSYKKYFRVFLRHKNYQIFVS